MTFNIPTPFWPLAPFDSPLLEPTASASNLFFFSPQKERPSGLKFNQTSVTRLPTSCQVPRNDLLLGCEAWHADLPQQAKTDSRLALNEVAWTGSVSDDQSHGVRPLETARTAFGTDLASLRNVVSSASSGTEPKLLYSGVVSLDLLIKEKNRDAEQLVTVDNEPKSLISTKLRTVESRTRNVLVVRATCTGLLHGSLAIAEESPFLIRLNIDLSTLCKSRLYGGCAYQHQSSLLHCRCVRNVIY